MNFDHEAINHFMRRMPYIAYLAATFFFATGCGDTQHETLSPPHQSTSPEDHNPTKAQIDQLSNSTPNTDWRTYENAGYLLKLPGTLDTEEVSPITGAYSIITTSSNTLISVVIMPSPSQHLTDIAIKKQDTQAAIDAATTMYPGLSESNLDPSWQTRSTGEPVFNLKFSRPTGGLRAVCQIWRWPEAGSIVFLLVSTQPNAVAASLLDQIATKMEVTATLHVPLEMASPKIHVDVPEDWTLSTDIKKKYWTSPAGTAFFMASHPFPAPGASRFQRYSLEEGWAGLAIRTIETLSGHPHEVSSSELWFNKSLWCMMSKATGKAEYSSGEYQVTMWRWIDPRTQRFHRVYFGGVTESDIQEAQEIANSYTLVSDQ